MPFNFTKMHGCGNDFIMVDAMRETLPQDLEGLARAVNDRRFGVGGDGLILIDKGSKAPFRMRMFNPDGTEAEMCGNGVRCLAKYARERGLTQEDIVSLETGAGILNLEIIPRPCFDEGEVGRGLGGGVDGVAVSAIRVNMGKARFLRGEIPMKGPRGEPAVAFPIEVAGVEMKATAVSMGNPHCVIFVEDAEAVPLEEWGRSVELNPMFPNKTNAHFVQAVSRTKLIQKTWERGAGRTLACGTGACASLVAAVLNDIADRTASVSLPGGTLGIEYAEDGTVYMTGPAETVFDGRWERD